MRALSAFVSPPSLTGPLTAATTRLAMTNYENVIIGVALCSVLLGAICAAFWLWSRTAEILTRCLLLIAKTELVAGQAEPRLRSVNNAINPQNPDPDSAPSMPADAMEDWTPDEILDHITAEMDENEEKEVREALSKFQP